MARSVRLSALLLVAALAGMALGRRVEAQQFQYTAKFVIGRSNGEILAPGQYFTAINVYNPGVTTTAPRISKRFVIALPKESNKGPAIGPIGVTLNRGEALEIDTRDIYTRLNMQPPTFVKGFVVITSTVELDVVGVYTAAGATNQVETLHMERVPARRVAGPTGSADEAPAGAAPAPAEPE